jgi:hypothetical protein
VTLRLWVVLLQVVTALREAGTYWRRVLVGAFLGWLIASIVGAVVLALAWEQISLETSNVLGALIVWSGLALGGVVGYATRRRV